MPFERLELSVQKQLGAVRTDGAIRSKKIGSRSNGWIYPFKKNWEPFERLELSVPKKLGAVRTAWAIRSKKIGSRSNGWSYTFQKSCEPFELDVRGERLAICFETVAYNSFGRDVSSRDPVKLFALNRIFFPAKEEATLKTKQPTRFQGLFKVTNQITGRGKTKSIMWQILLHGGKIRQNPPPPQKKMNEFNFKPAQYYINKIFELTKSCIWAISKWM